MSPLRRQKFAADTTLGFATAGAVSHPIERGRHLTNKLPAEYADDIPNRRPSASSPQTTVPAPAFSRRRHPGRSNEAQFFWVYTNAGGRYTPPPGTYTPSVPGSAPRSDVLILVFMLPTSRAVAAAAVCSAAACVVRCRCASPLCDLSGSPACKCFSAAAAAAASGLRPGPSDPLRRRCWPALPHARAPA